MNWDEYFINIAEQVKLKSKDKRTQIGVVVVGKDNEIVSTGYNSFARGINDNLDLFQNNLTQLKASFSSFSFSDHETKEMMKDIYNKFNYISEPHGAIGYLGLKKHSLHEDEFGSFFKPNINGTQ